MTFVPSRPAGTASAFPRRLLAVWVIFALLWVAAGATLLTLSLLQEIEVSEALARDIAALDGAEGGVPVTPFADLLLLTLQYRGASIAAMLLLPPFLVLVGLVLLVRAVQRRRAAAEETQPLRRPHLWTMR